MNLARDLESPAALYAKGGLFVVLGLLSGGLLVWRHPSVLAAGLLVTCVWAWCRAYYFAFHVVERYAGGRRYAGLVDVLRRRPGRRDGSVAEPPAPHRGAP